MAHDMTSGATSGSALPEYTRNQTAWVGWVVFAGMVLVLLGVFHVMQGMVALLRDEVFLVGQNGLLVNLDYAAWGWTHLVAGLLTILIGAGLLAARMWARLAAVGLAFLSAIINLAFLPAYPIWSALMIALDVVVMWAVLVHGDELRRPSTDPYHPQRRGPGAPHSSGRRTTSEAT